MTTSNEQIISKEQHMILKEIKGYTESTERNNINNKKIK